MKKILFIVLICSFSVQFSNAQIIMCVDSSLINPNCICGMIYEPVCGCNGQLYSNPCLAQCDGVTYWTPAVIDSNGTCYLVYLLVILQSMLKRLLPQVKELLMG